MSQLCQHANLILTRMSQVGHTSTPALCFRHSLGSQLGFLAILIRHLSRLYVETVKV